LLDDQISTIGKLSQSLEESLLLDDQIDNLRLIPLTELLTLVDQITKAPPPSRFAAGVLQAVSSQM